MADGAPLSYIFGVYAFSVGCGCFTWDALAARPLRHKYLVGCLLFDLGCAFFLLDAHRIELPTP